MPGSRGAAAAIDTPAGAQPGGDLDLVRLVLLVLVVLVALLIALVRTTPQVRDPGQWP